jgi:hypothetical protein
MKKITHLFFLFIFFLVGVEYLSAHVGLEYPLGGETFAVGDKIEIKWNIEIDHGPNNWDLYFSSDGGENWEELQLDIEKSQIDYLWTVPDIVTESARIKIVQDNDSYVNLEDESANFTITDVQTSVGLQDEIPTVFKLHSNYPNPFNPTTIINYDLPRTMNADLSVYNVLGQKVTTLISGIQHAGFHSVTWDASYLAGGAYFIKLQADEFVQIKKSILLK